MATLNLYEIYELIKSYTKASHAQLLSFLFGDSNGDFWYTVGRNKIIPVQLQSKMEPSCVIDNKTGRFQSKWFKAFSEHPQILLKNINDTVRIIPEDKLKDFFSTFYKICQDLKIEKYISENDDIKQKCANAIYIIFLNSIGYNLDKLFFHDKAQTENKKRLIKDTSKIVITQSSPYFAQRVYDDKTNRALLNTAKLDFSKLKDNKRVVIKGPGGQGKTRLITEIKSRSRNSEFFSYVFSIELTILMPAVEEFMKSKISSDATTDFILSYISENNNADPEDIYSNATDITKKPVLIMLDGFNELYTSTNPVAIKTLTEEIQRISNEWGNTYIIITCRCAGDDLDFKNRYQSLQNYRQFSLSGVPEKEYNDYIKAHPKLTDTIKNLVSIPLYYNHLSTLKDNIPTTQFDLLMQIYGKLFRQSQCTSDDYYAFYIAAPYIAQTIDNYANNQITPAQITNIVRNLHNKNLDLLFETTLEITGDKNIFSYAEISVEKVCKILTQNGPLVLCNDNKYLKFRHDDIKDSMIAFNVLRNIKALENSYNTNDITAVCDIYADLNVSVSVANLVKENLQLKDKKTADKNLENLYSSITKNNDFELNETAILYIHTAFLISDYLQIPYISIQNSLHKILGMATNECMLYHQNGNLDQIINIPDEKLNLRCRLALADIFSKECEYFRRSRRYVTGLKLAALAEKISSDNQQIINQKAKLYIYLHRDIITRRELLETFDIKSEGFIKVDELYTNALSLLEYNSEKFNFNLSSSVLGMLYSVPAPYLIKYTSQQFDCVKAFWANYCTITTKKQKDYSKREIDYPIRQAVALLLKGYVRLRDGFIYKAGMLAKLNLSSFEEGNKNPLLTDSSTLALAEDLLKLADGQYIKGFNYLRGMIKMFSGSNIYAERLFISEDDNLLNQIILNEKFSRKYDIDAKYNEIKETILKPENKDGLADSCHPVYWYCDAKNLDLSFNPDRADFFNEFETALSDECKTIVQKLTK